MSKFLDYLDSFRAKLSAIFPDQSNVSAAGIQPLVCLMSPKESGKLSAAGFPAWTGRTDEADRLPWLHLPISPGRMKVVGVDANEKPSMKREYWAAQSVGKDQLAAE